MSVVLAVIDGLRSDAIEVGDCPNLKALMAQSAFTLQATSIMPSMTLPCHTSIFYSVPPTRHGITSNTWLPMARPLPGLFEQAAAAGLRCASFYNWEPLRDLSRPGRLSHAYFINNFETDPHGDQIIATEATRYLANHATDFAFVYFGTLDTAGHNYGWMSPAYLAQLERVDRALGILIGALPDDASVLLQSDHGGHERGHGSDSPADMTIPWLVSGPGIKQNYQLIASVSLLDTAPTLARLLGIAPHPQWEGRCLDEIFETTTSSAQQIVNEILSLLETGRHIHYGEEVTQLQHALQCARLAVDANSTEEVIIAALLHDIGHLCETADTEHMGDVGVVDHETIGADYLRQRGFSEKIAQLVQGHVEAKRYLTFKDPQYATQLSPASLETLTYQGGPMSAEEAAAFEQDPLFEAKLQLRTWDEQGKELGWEVHPANSYRDLLLRHLRKNL